MKWVNLLIGPLLATLVGFHFGYEARVRSTNDRYLMSLAEKHEATARYWDTQTNEIISNNTLERKRRDAKH